MATFGQMKTWVSKRLQDPNNASVSSDDVGEMINQALNYWKNERFFFNEVADSTTIAQGNATVPLPSNWLIPSIDNCFVLDYSGVRRPLRKISEQYYNGIYLSNGIGQPRFFCKQANTQYQVYPIPDRDYTIRRFYIKDYDNFSADADTNDFSTSATNLLQYTAAAYGSRDFRQDMNMYQWFMAQTEIEEANILAITTKGNATGSLTIY